MTDFFDAPPEWATRSIFSSRKLGKLFDFLLDTRLKASATFNEIQESAKVALSQNILVLGVIVPGRESDMKRVADALTSRNHKVDFSFATMQPKGKFENINDALARRPRPLDDYDWVIVVDDDVGFPAHFIDNTIELLTRHAVDLAQPAHRRYSYTSWQLTARKWGSLIRRTSFVEIGPVTIFNKRIFSATMPFPYMRWCWGLDAYWSHLAKINHWILAVVDATAIEHQKPVGATYDRAGAEAEGKAFLIGHEVTLNQRDMMAPGSILSHW